MAQSPLHLPADGGSTASTRPAPDRSEDTRRRLIEAALALFAEHGFDGTTTRMLATTAGTNQAAIPYHFGGKEGLYMAVADHIADTNRRLLEPVAVRIKVALSGDRDGPDRTALRAVLDDLLRSMIGILFSDAGLAKRAAFVLHEQFHPGPAFDRLYAGFIRPMHEMLTDVVARTLGLPPEDPQAIIRAHTIVGQWLAFMIARTAVQRRLGWETIGPQEQAAIVSGLQAMVRGGLGLSEPEAAPADA